MRILLVHEADEARARIVQVLIKAMPDAIVEMWDPARRGLPSASIDWKRFDLAFVDERDPGATLEWLHGLATPRVAALPALVVMGRAGAPSHAEAISQAGAETEFVDIDEQTYTMSPQALAAYLEGCAIDKATGFPLGQRTKKPIKASTSVRWLLAMGVPTTTSC